MAIYSVYSITHPYNLKEFTDSFNAASYMSDLVEIGHLPICEKTQNGEMIKLSWEEMIGHLNG